MRLVAVVMLVLLALSEIVGATVSTTTITDDELEELTDDTLDCEELLEEELLTTELVVELLSEELTIELNELLLLD